MAKRRSPKKWRLFEFNEMPQVLAEITPERRIVLRCEMHVEGLDDKQIGTITWVQSDNAAPFMKGHETEALKGIDTKDVREFAEKCARNEDWLTPDL